MRKKIIAVIPAKGNSRAIPKKNIVKILGKPLIYYTIKEAKKSKLIDDLIVSTDSKEISKISKKYGAKVPFIRPKYLSTDFMQSLPVVKHALLFMEKLNKRKYDYVVMLQPTCPLRSCIDIDSSLKPSYLQELAGLAEALIACHSDANSPLHRHTIFDHP